MNLEKKLWAVFAKSISKSRFDFTYEMNVREIHEQNTGTAYIVQVFY